MDAVVDATEDDIREPALPHQLKQFGGTVVEVTAVVKNGGAVESAWVTDSRRTFKIPVGQKGLKITFKGFSSRFDRWFASADETLLPAGSERTTLRLVKKAEKDDKRKRELRA